MTVLMICLKMYHSGPTIKNIKAVISTALVDEWFTLIVAGLALNYHPKV